LIICESASQYILILKNCFNDYSVTTFQKYEIRIYYDTNPPLGGLGGKTKRDEPGFNGLGGKTKRDEPGFNGLVVKTKRDEPGFNGLVVKTKRDEPGFNGQRGKTNRDKTKLKGEFVANYKHDYLCC
jgi:hypothetical protein